MIARLLALVAGLVVVGCAARPITVDMTDVPRFARTEAGPCPARHVLVLSSGGADGAFGAGVLAGWSASGSRPGFDIVTGVSTGALQAPLAFLGPGYDELLRDVYTQTTTDDVIDRNGLGALFKTGLGDLAPLQATLDAVMTDALVDAVAAEHRKGRRLFVATSDLTAGRRVVWDLGALAASADPARRERLVGLLLASVAAPGLIEPIILRSAPDDEAAHGDGGVLGPILVPTDALEAGCGPRPTVWIVANGHVSTTAATRAAITDPVEAGRRGVSQLLRRLLYITIVATHAQIERAGAQFRLAALPTHVPEAASPFAFAPDEMRTLYEVGWRIGYERAWASAPPRE